MLPGVGAALKNVQVDDKQFDRIEAISSSMTNKEKNDIKLLGKSRIKRIANGSGTNPSEVNRFVKQFEMMKKMSKQMAGSGLGSKMGAMKDLAGGMDPHFNGWYGGNARIDRARFHQNKIQQTPLQTPQTKINSPPVILCVLER